VKLFHRSTSTSTEAPAASATATQIDTQARDEAARLRTVLDALPIGVVVRDGEGTGTISNTAARALGGHADVLLDAAIDEQLSRAARGASATETLEFFGPPRRVMVVKAVPLTDGGAMALVEDVSERSRLDAVRTDFVANISHELKTPVGAMAVLAEALEDSLDDVDTARRLAERISAEAHRLSRTIDDLLELSRIELGGDAIRQQLDVSALLHEAADRHSTTALHQSVSLRVEVADQLSAFGDRRQLTSAVANLIDNAIKYSDPGGEITVTAAAVGHESGTTDDGWIELIVSDQGVGIPARDLDRVFERFYRVDRARSRETGGTGLGLAIVRHVATNHGGEVSVTSQEGVGSTFTVRIPSNGRT
jgi:two-component system, OmpR family, sensor histidine kinase SenX3